MGRPVVNIVGTKVEAPRTRRRMRRIAWRRGRP